MLVVLNLAVECDSSQWANSAPDPRVEVAYPQSVGQIAKHTETECDFSAVMKNGEWSGVPQWCTHLDLSWQKRIGDHEAKQLAVDIADPCRCTTDNTTSGVPGACAAPARLCAACRNTR